MKSDEFEILCFDLVKEIGFINTVRQTSGSQFGYDISADRTQKGTIQKWVFECKKYTYSRVPIKEVSSKLLWADNQPQLHCFVLVSNVEISNDLRHFLDSHHQGYYILAWTGGVFLKLLSSCPRAFNKWFAKCPKPRFLSAQQFLSEECSRFWDEQTLSEQETPDTKKFDLTLRVRQESPGDPDFRLVILDERKRRIADFSVQKGAETRISISNEFKKKRVLIWYDFYPNAFTPGYNVTFEELRLSRNKYLIPSQKFMKRLASKEQKRGGTRRSIPADWTISPGNPDIDDGDLE